MRGRDRRRRRPGGRRQTLVVAQSPVAAVPDAGKIASAVVAHASAFSLPTSVAPAPAFPVPAARPGARRRAAARAPGERKGAAEDACREPSAEQTPRQHGVARRPGRGSGRGVGGCGPGRWRNRRGWRRGAGGSAEHAVLLPSCSRASLPPLPSTLLVCGARSDGFAHRVAEKGIHVIRRRRTRGRWGRGGAGGRRGGRDTGEGRGRRLEVGCNAPHVGRWNRRCACDDPGLSRARARRNDLDVFAPRPVKCAPSALLALSSLRTPNSALLTFRSPAS